MSPLSAAIALERSYRPLVSAFIKFLSALCFGILLGLSVTLAVVEHGKGFGAVEAGPWTGWVRNSTSDIDPYTQAILAYSGETPLSESDSMTFVANGDSNGREFDPACDYSVEGEIPTARYWTLALLSPAGVPATSRRQGFTSSEVLRTSDGKFKIEVSPHARPGNWLPLGDASKFILVLRLYDSELSLAAGRLSAADMPVLVKGHCE